MELPEIEPAELERMRRTGEPFQLIDVREPYEAEICGLNGQLIPMGELLQRLDEIRRDMPVVVHCRSGNRSQAVVAALRRHGFTNVTSLRGGLQGYARDVDPALTCE